MLERLFILILATGIAFWAAGCDQSGTKAPDDTAKEAGEDEHAGHDHPEGETHDEMSGDGDSAATEPAAAAGGQTMCPVSGHEIDLAVYTEHEGKKVYFCCDACIEDFKKNPDKYLALLPQFGGKEDPDKVEGS